jgi:predicted kinase
MACLGIARVQRKSQTKKQLTRVRTLKKLILLVGIPASGKSTLAKKLIQKGFICINADAIRAELYGDELKQGDPQEVFSVFFDRLEALMKEEKDIVVDNTNLKIQHRKQILDRGQKFGYEDIQLWVLDVPLDVCLKRNAARERKVEEDILANMFMSFNRSGRPRKEEGKLVLIRPGKDADDFRFFFPG